VEVGHGQAQRAILRGTKIGIITILLRRVVSEIKLKRTDTTLDLCRHMLVSTLDFVAQEKGGTYKPKGKES